MTPIETVLVERIAQLRMQAEFSAAAAAQAAAAAAQADELQTELDAYRQLIAGTD